MTTTVVRRTEADNASQGDPLLTAALLAIGGSALGGAALAGPPGAARDAWLAAFAAASPGAKFPVRLGRGTDLTHLEGSLDLTAVLATGRRAEQAGVLEALCGRALMLAGAERWSTANVGLLLSACEARCDDTIAMPVLIALDESRESDETPPELLAGRLAFRVVLDEACAGTLLPDAGWIRRVAAARARFARIDVPENLLAALVAASAALGIGSSRVDTLAVAATRAHAAWRGVSCADETDAEAAACLVLAHRAQRWPETSANEPPPAPQSADDENASSSPETQPADTPRHPEENERGDAALDDRLVAAASATIPPGLLEALRDSAGSARTGAPAGGRARGTKRKAHHGRPVGSVPGDPRHDGPLDLLATIMAAAPWQPLRRRLIASSAREQAVATSRVIVLPSDIRVTRFQHHAPATTVFALDASGSSALYRMAEAKGAIELLLAQCYVRREKVAVVAFRGRRAEVLLPPTRALARARRALSGLPGGGATPLAAGIDAAHALALAARRAGDAALIVILTDGRANIDRTGTADRRRANSDAEAAAQGLAADRLPAMVIDTSPVPGPKAGDLARAMRARYIALPHAGAREIAGIVARAGASAQ